MALAQAVGRLYGSRVYLAGPMDRVPDGGTVWRTWITPHLQEKGLVVLDPCDKPIDIAFEKVEDREYRAQLKAAGRYDELAKEIKLLRQVDLRLVDMADFLIVYMNTDVHMCGTYEELFWANRLKNPVLIVCEQGKEGAPDWMFGVIPHQHIFDNFNDLLSYLNHVNHDKEIDHMKRWLFFDYARLVPNIIGMTT